MNDTQAPRMIVVDVAVTHADAAKYGPDSWLVESFAEAEPADPESVETVLPGLTTPGQSRRLAAVLHLTRTFPGHRVAKIARASVAEEADVQAELDDYGVRAFRAELRLVAQG